MKWCMCVWQLTRAAAAVELSSGKSCSCSQEYPVALSLSFSLGCMRCCGALYAIIAKTNAAIKLIAKQIDAALTPRRWNIEMTCWQRQSKYRHTRNDNVQCACELIPFLAAACIELHVYSALVWI